MTHPYASIAVELTREIASRESAYPRLIAKGHMTKKDADRGIHMARTWLEDCHRYRTAEENEKQRDLQNAATIARARACTTIHEMLAVTGALPGFDGVQALAQDGRRFPAAVLNAFPWPTRWRAIQEELDRRAQLYPRWIAQGQLDKIDAATRIERLTAMLHRYDEMDDWRPSNGTRPRPFATNQTPEERASAQECAPYLCAIMLRRNQLTPDQARLYFPDNAPAEQKEMFA